MSEPTKAAMKAALRVNSGFTLSVFSTCEPLTNNDVSEIIDRETGLPELVAALKRQVQSHESIAICLENDPTPNGIIASAKQCGKFAEEGKAILRKAGEL